MASGSLFSSNQWHLTQTSHGPASGPLSVPSHGSSWPSTRWQSSQWNLGWSSLCSPPWSHHSWPPAGTWSSGSSWVALHTWAAVDEVSLQPHGNKTHLHEVIRNFIHPRCWWTDWSLKKMAMDLWLGGPVRQWSSMSNLGMAS